MILVCGSLADPVTELLCERLGDSGYSYRLLDLETYPAGFRVNWRWQGRHPIGYIVSELWRLDLREITAVYLRHLGAEERKRTKNLPDKFVPAFHAECDLGLTALIESLPCLVVNRERGGISNQSKPYQALQIRLGGLRTPPTLLTNDPEAARRFYEEYEGQVVYKSISGTRSIVRQMNTEDLARLPLLENGPAQFQAFISGDDIRVHIVGDRCFATRIRSKAVDYRYAHEEKFSVQMEPAVLPVTVATACLRIAGHFQLLFAGIDLKETPDGHYYCFEVNPSPAFIFYERCSGQPISQALAELLHKGWIDEGWVTTDSAS